MHIFNGEHFITLQSGRIESNKNNCCTCYEDRFVNFGRLLRLFSMSGPFVTNVVLPLTFFRKQI